MHDSADTRDSEAAPRRREDATLAERWLQQFRHLCIVAALVCSLVQQTFLTSYRVAGNSMTPSFLDGDRVVVAATPGFFGEPRRGETVIARVDGEVLIKRVAGVPGDTIELGRGRLRRDGRLVDDPIPASYRDECDCAPRHLGPGEYFLLGDHRRVSIDSREFGPVGRASILGRVILRVPQQGAGVLAPALARHPSPPATLRSKR